MEYQWVLFIVMLTTIRSITYGGPLEILQRQKRNPTELLLPLVEAVSTKIIEGTEIQKDVVKNVQDAVKKIDKAIVDIENSITLMTENIGVVTAQRWNVTRQAIIRYRNVKQTLRETRNELKALAMRTIHTTDDLITYMQAWDSEIYSAEEQKEYLKEQIKLLKELLVESKSKLSNARNKYDESMRGLDLMVEEINDVKSSIRKLQNNNSDEYASMASNIRLGVYSGAGAVTVGMIFADIFGCLGICSAVFTSSTWAVSLVSVEALLAEARASLEQLEATVDRALHGLNGIEAQNEHLQQFIQVESDLIIQWQESVVHLDVSITSADVEKLQGLSLKRDVVTNNLIKLKTAATNFLNQPDIWPQNKLITALNDPEKIEANRNVIAQVGERRRNPEIRGRVVNQGT